MPTLEEALDVGANANRDRDERAQLEHALEASPDLKANLERALERGFIQSIRFGGPMEAGAGGQYDNRTQSLSIPPNRNSLAETVFVLGHETQHALSLRGQPAPYETRLVQDVERIHDRRLRQGDRAPDVAPSTRIDPSDYTLPVYDCIEGSRREEAQAHIGGFNAVVSYLTKRNNGDPPTLQQMYEALPGRMGDFIETAGSAPRLEYRMKAGLTLSENGRLEPTEANIEAMKRHYADKFPGTFGPNGLLDYRHMALVNAWEYIHTSEQRVVDNWNVTHWHERDAEGRLQSARQAADAHLRNPPPTYAYRIDFEALGANPAILKFPHDGIVKLVDKPLEHAYLDEADESVAAANPRRAAIDAGFSPARDAIRSRDHAQYMLREQGTLPRSFGDIFRSAPNADELTPNRVNPPQNLRDDHAPAPGPIALAADPLAVRAPVHMAGAGARPVADEPDLVAQARRALRAMNDRPERGDDEKFENLAAALALEAHRSGLNKIDHVVWSKDRIGLIAIDGRDPNAADAQHASVNYLGARVTSAKQSTGQLIDLIEHAQQRAPQPAHQAPAAQDRAPAAPNAGLSQAEDPTTQTTERKRSHSQ